MISIQNRITAFAKLGDFLSQFTINDIKKIDHIEHNEIFFDGFLHQIKLAEENNSWFNKKNILFSLENLSKSLANNSLVKFTESINLTNKSSKNVAIIMAGNIPMVDFMISYQC